MHQRTLAATTLPWTVSRDGYRNTESVLRAAFSDIRRAGISAVPAEPATDLSIGQYLDLLAEFGLVTAPGYFSMPDHRLPSEDIAALARRFAGDYSAFGHSRVFIASAMSSERLARGARHVALPLGVLDDVVEALRVGCQALANEGIRAMLHPHVGSTIESEVELRAALDGISPDLLAFGPDTGHLAWAGVEPAAFIADYAPRVEGLHLKDLSASEAAGARDAGSDYEGSTLGPFAVWRELGDGDVDLVGSLGALPPGFDGWIVVEVDAPAAKTPLASLERSLRWLASHGDQTL